jgi:hypothetical protein
MLLQPEALDAAELALVLKLSGDVLKALMQQVLADPSQQQSSSLAGRGQGAMAELPAAVGQAVGEDHVMAGGLAATAGAGNIDVGGLGDDIDETAGAGDGFGLLSGGLRGAAAAGDGLAVRDAGEGHRGSDSWLDMDMI